MNIKLKKHLKNNQQGGIIQMSYLIAISLLATTALSSPVLNPQVQYPKADYLNAEIPTNNTPHKLRNNQPIVGGYYRTWHDEAIKSDKNMKGGNSQDVAKAVNNFGEIPKEVDVAFIFDAHTDKDSNFWTKLGSEYAPKLQQQGTAVVRTIGYDFLAGVKGILKDNDNIKKSAAEQAALIVKEYVYKYGLDGLDIDIEKGTFGTGYGPGPSDVLREIAKLIGPNGKDKSKLFVIDTDLSAGEYLLQHFSYENLDFLLLQVYGDAGEKRIDFLYDKFKDKIDANKILLGFSNYEENSTAGYKDTVKENKEGKQESRAERYAKRKTKDGKHFGGLFAYAIERDGVADGTNTLTKTQYEEIKKLKASLLAERPKKLEEQKTHPDQVAKVNSAPVVKKTQQDTARKENRVNTHNADNTNQADSAHNANNVHQGSGRHSAKSDNPQMSEDKKTNEDSANLAKKDTPKQEEQAIAPDNEQIISYQGQYLVDFTSVRDGLFASSGLANKPSNHYQVFSHLFVGGAKTLDNELSLGGFISYEAEKAQHLGVAFALGYKNISGFVRYRYAFVSEQEALKLKLSKNAWHHIDYALEYKQRLALADSISVTPFVKGLAFTKIATGSDNPRATLKLYTGVELGHQLSQSLEYFAKLRLGTGFVSTAGDWLFSVGGGLGFNHKFYKSYSWGAVATIDYQHNQSLSFGSGVNLGYHF